MTSPRPAGRDPAEIERSSGLDLSQPWDNVRRDAEAPRGRRLHLPDRLLPSECRAHLDRFVSDLASEIGDF